MKNHVLQTLFNFSRVSGKRIQVFAKLHADFFQIEVLDDAVDDHPCVGRLKGMLTHVVESEKIVRDTFQPSDFCLNCLNKVGWEGAFFVLNAE